MEHWIESQQHRIDVQQLVHTKLFFDQVDFGCSNFSSLGSGSCPVFCNELLPEYLDEVEQPLVVLGNGDVKMTPGKTLGNRHLEAIPPQIHTRRMSVARKEWVRANDFGRGRLVFSHRYVSDQRLLDNDGQIRNPSYHNGKDLQPDFNQRCRPDEGLSGALVRSDDVAEFLNNPKPSLHQVKPLQYLEMRKGATPKDIALVSDDERHGSSGDFESGRKTWPVWGAHAEFGMHNRDNRNFFSDPTLFEHLAAKDGFVFQSAYPSKKWINDRYATLSAMKKLNPSLRVALYIWPNAVAKSPGSRSLNRFNDELIRSPVDGNLDWFLMNKDGIQTEHGRKFWKTNEADHVLPRNSLGETYSESWWRALKSALTKNGTKNLLEVIDGFYNDVTGLGPRQVFIKNGTTAVNGDYDLDGKGDPNPGAGGDLYRTGMAQWIDRFMEAGFPQTFAFIGNGGLDGYDHDKGKLPVPMRKNPLYGKWHGRQAEGAGMAWGLGVVKGTYEIDVKKPERALETRLRRTALMEPYLSDKSPWGMSFIWWEASCANTNPPTLDDYRFMRANAALSRGYDAVIYAISMDGKEPAPRLDEHKVHPGAQLPSWQPWGLVDETDASFEMRSPDYVDGSAEFYFFPYENVLWVFRSDQSAAIGSRWPAGATASASLPDPGDGYHYEFLRGAQDPELNRGGTVTGAGHGSVSLRQWEALMLLRVKN